MSREPGVLGPSARTSLRHVGGPSRRRGDADLCELLAFAFDVGEEDINEARAHVHGFHSYPARLHPLTARRLLEQLAAPGDVVLDPFCGSGTVLVEARLRGALARGTDVNPLALRIARLKTRGVPENERAAILDAARWVEAHVTKRRETKARVTKRYDDVDVGLFDPHVLLELDSIRDGIDRIDPLELRADLELVFSAILTKASRQRGDTGAYTQHRRLAPGFVARLLVAKAQELVLGLETFERMLPPGAPEADAHSDDARVLGTIAAGKVQLVVTSPPYAGTYDYVDHHDVRLRWLRMREDRFASLELGARRDYARLDLERAQARWNDELGRTLGAIGRVLFAEGTAVLVLADSAVGEHALRADTIVGALAHTANLEVVAAVSQTRPHFHHGTQRAFAESPREEHLIALRHPR